MTVPTGYSSPPGTFVPPTPLDFFIATLTIWRESSNQSAEAMYAVACTIRNRAMLKSWMGHDPVSVCTKHMQFSSMTYHLDPNLTRWPQNGDAAWTRAASAVRLAFDGATHPWVDGSRGAVFYFTPPLTDPPATWGPVEETVQVGDIKFYRSIPQNGRAVGEVET